MAQSIQSHGKRKTAIARVTVVPGEGKVEVNDGKSLEVYFPREAHRRAALSPLVLTERAGSYDVKVRVRGGGITGQAEAVRHGIARALVALEEDLRPILKKAGFLTRDPRIVESKKYGHHKARRSPQFSKR
ncbi:MAG: 30S ribosomal protein S9 [Deferrisomatales bacterium]|nr:30S ribosomal protein S9 [Deferrisomatales bacterium]